MSVKNRSIIYALFRSSVKRSSRSTFRNDQVSEVRRGTYGSLPEFGLQTAVQRAHSADRCCFLYSHRFARSVLYFVFIRWFAIQNPCFSVWTGIASVSRVSLAFFGPRYDRQCTLSHGQLDLGTSSGTSSRYRQLSLFLHSTIHHQYVSSFRAIDAETKTCFYYFKYVPLIIARKTEDGTENAASQSIAAVIMMIFQYSTNPGSNCHRYIFIRYRDVFVIKDYKKNCLNVYDCLAHHCQLLECLMALKPGVVKDILCVVAYGTAPARASAAKLLFYYWPSFNPNLFDRRAVLMKFASAFPHWVLIIPLKPSFDKIQNMNLTYADDLAPFVCQRDSCPNAGNAEAGKVCYDHRISITFATETPPPMYLCIECANEIHRAHPNQMFYDILHPMQQVSMICENKVSRMVFSWKLI